MASTKQAFSKCLSNECKIEWLEKHISLFCCMFGFTETSGFFFFSFWYHSFLPPCCLPQSVLIESLRCVRHWAICQRKWDTVSPSLEGPEWVVLIMLVLSQAAILGESPTTESGALRWLFVGGCGGGRHYPHLETLAAHGVGVVDK